MFLRVKRSVHGERVYEYLQIVESVRHGQKVRQRVLCTLGRLDQVIADGTVDGLLRSLAKFSQQLQVVETVRREGLEAHEAKTWGPALVFERLWQRQRLPEIIGRLADKRSFEFDVERTTFALALQRLCHPGSDLQGWGWVKTVECQGFAEIELQHLYRTVGWFLAREREPLEQELFWRDRDLFAQELDLVFLDTTSTFVWRDTETGLRKRGYSRDRRPDQPQVVLCVAVDKHGWPVAWDILPGNTADKKAFVLMIERFRERFRIRRVIVVADRAMLSKDTIKLLTEQAEAPFEYILGCRMRRYKEVSEQVLARAGRYRKVAGNLEVKEVKVGDRRYLVCRNPDEQRKDAEARQSILDRLRLKLDKQGPKSVIGNKGFARFLTVDKASVSINQEAVEADARLDGKFVLRTNTDLDPEEVALAYKSLWRVERTFREQKSTLEVRPIYHQSDPGCIGHIVASFLALRLEVDLQRRLDERQVDVSWPDLMRDLAQVHAVYLTLDEQDYRLRTQLRGSAHHAFAAAGVRPPPVVTHLGPSETLEVAKNVVPKSCLRLVTD